MNMVGIVAWLFLLLGWVAHSLIKDNVMRTIVGVGFVSFAMGIVVGYALTSGIFN